MNEKVCNCVNSKGIIVKALIVNCQNGVGSRGMQVRYFRLTRTNISIWKHVKDTAMEIEKALITDHLRVSKPS